MAFHPSKPAGLVSGSLKFLFSSLLPSEATVSAPSDMLALVHLLGLASSPPPSLSLCYLPAAGAHSFLCESGRQRQSFVFLAALCFPLCHQPLPSFFSTSRCDRIELSLTYRKSHPPSLFAFIPS